MRCMTVRRDEYVVKCGVRDNKSEIPFRGTFNHVTPMAVVSEASKIMKGLVLFRELSPDSTNRLMVSMEPHQTTFLNLINYT